MSDIDPELPDFLIDAILSQGPPTEDVDLVKNAFAWRTIDAELMELSYDSVLDTAGVRDASARRTLEFTVGDISILVEIEDGSVRGQLSPGDVASVVRLIGINDSSTAQIEASGAFVFPGVTAGSYRLELTTDAGSISSAAFAVG